MQACVNFMTSSNFEQMKTVFEKLDLDFNGFLSPEELLQGFLTCGIEGDINQIVASIGKGK